MHFRCCYLNKTEQPLQHIAVQISALAAAGLRECVLIISAKQLEHYDPSKRL
jgi:hypothetical protein